MPQPSYFRFTLTDKNNNSIILADNEGNALPPDGESCVRGAEIGEFYFGTMWYGIYHPLGPPIYNELQQAIVQCTNHGRNLNIKYHADLTQRDINPSLMQRGTLLSDKTSGVLYNIESTPYRISVSFDYGSSWTLREYYNNPTYYFTTYSTLGELYKM